MRVLAFFFLVFALWPAPAAAAPEATRPFRFELYETEGAMSDFLRENFSLESKRGDLRRVFVEEGGATMIAHPTRENVEKYIYDIDLCHYYVWRWNVSADYDAGGNLRQLYLNGRSRLRGAAPPPMIDKKSKTARIVKITRPRPQAYKGEDAISAIVFDADGNLLSIEDQLLIGAGPSRANPADLGPLIMYKEVSPWRSIFDADTAKEIAPYGGGCAAADQKYRQLLDKKILEHGK